MYWTDIPCSSELMARIFSIPPKVGLIELYNMEIDFYSYKILINFDLIDLLPDKAPKKWGSFNRCRLGLYCLGVLNVNIKQYIDESNRYRAHIDFKSNGDCHEIEIITENQDILVTLKCGYIYLADPEVYMNGE